MRDELLAFALHRGAVIAFYPSRRTRPAATAAPCGVIDPVQHGRDVAQHAEAGEVLPDQALVRHIFGDVYNVKRLAPGQLRPPRDGLILHDCSTLGGNSGSPVIWEQMNQAVGIHTHGGCTSSGGQNSGTSISHPALQNALANPLGGSESLAPHGRR